jgi:N-acetylglucosamine-6-phosphate deacetylase
MSLVNCSGVDARTATAGAPAPGLYFSPGFIDLQVNGFAGVDYNHPQTTLEDIARSLHAQFATGVTRLYPTVITGAPTEMAACLRHLAIAREQLDEGDAIAGFHVEGPHIAPDDGPRGAHPRQWVRPPDTSEFDRWQEAARGLIRIVTISPEYPGTPAYIEHIVARGVVASIGHTQADASQLADAVAAGASLSTHLGNGAHQLLRRHPNYIWDQLADDRLMAGFIVDGIHLGAAFLKSAIRAKGIERSVLVTDASTPAGAAPGRYLLADQPVDLTHDGRVVLAGTDRLAGSALFMNRGVANLIRLAGLSLAGAVRMATENPARAAHLQPNPSDVVEFRVTDSGQIEVVRTWLAGRLICGAPEPSL